MTDWREIQQDIYYICDYKKWDKDYLKGGCYIHLEVSEFIESLRGKGDDSPAKEAADVLFTLLSVMTQHDIDMYDVIDELKKMIFNHQSDNLIDWAQKIDQAETLMKIKDPNEEYLD